MSRDKEILIFTGAGLSAESGLSTFRDSNGLWENYDLNVVCNYLTFKENKDKVLQFYSDRKENVLSVKPNQSHYYIADIQKKYGNQVKIFTANIDNLLEEAGCKDVIHLHGELFNMKCIGCGLVFPIGNDLYTKYERCPKCKCRFIKPNIIFFNERAPLYEKLNQTFHARKLNSRHVFLAVGTSFQVLGAERFIVKKSKEFGYKIFVNKENTEYDYLFNDVIYKESSIGLKDALIKIDDYITQYW